MNNRIFITGVAMLAAAALTAAEPPRLDRKPKPGVYALTNTCNHVLKEGKRVNLFDLPVDGVTNYVTWRMVQPEEGAVRYPGLDRMIAEAAASGKFLSYGILAGCHTPPWVYEKAGIPAVPYDTSRTPARQSYLPWLEKEGKRQLNTPFLEVWEETVKTFAVRLYADPHRDRFNYIPVTGFPFGNGLELYIPILQKDFEALRYDAEAKRLYIEFCSRVIDIFIRHLPDFPLGIAFTDWFGGTASGHRRSVEESAAILDYAVRKGKEAGVTIVPMGLWLGWKGVCDQPNHPMMRTWTKAAAASGFGAWEGQMGSCRLNCLPLKRQLELARENKVSWVQFWHHDCLCPDCLRMLQEWREEGGKLE